MPSRHRIDPVAELARTPDASCGKHAPDSTHPAANRGRRSLAAWLLVIVGLTVCAVAAEASSERFTGAVHGEGAPVEGAMVTFRHGDPAHTVTVFTDERGRFESPLLAFDHAYQLRVRRLGWRDLLVEDLSPGGEALSLTLERETDPAAVAEALPANVWYGLVLDRIEDDAQRTELKQQCTYCHQQGNWATHRMRDHDAWAKLILLMGRRGATLSRDLREQLPDIMIEAYTPETAIPALTSGMNEPGFAPDRPPEVRRAVIEEWELGGRASNQHDMMVHPSGVIYSVDMPQDELHRLDPSVPGGKRESFAIPHGDLEPGGVFASANRPTSTSDSYVGPHSLQTAPDGSVWITLAIGNQLARFDHETHEWTIHELDSGIYPHTLRFDQRGRVWYTMAASNHVGMFDPTTNEQHHIRLPSSTWQQEIILRSMPFLLWLGRHIDIRGQAAEGDGIQMPVPYGIDVAPDGSIWFSQLNEHRIGRIDADTFELEMIDTPFATPRRLRFDSKGQLWIPAFADSLIARFDPETREFETWPLPIEPLGTEVPYALAIQPGTDHVWICGTNSDSMIRFEPETERFTVFPMPTRVTYTREIDFDSEGRVWTSNSNGPTWQIERGVPQVIRIDPRSEAVEAAGAASGDARVAGSAAAAD
jgi:streptogramin lyase